MTGRLQSYWILQRCKFRFDGLRPPQFLNKGRYHTLIFGDASAQRKAATVLSSTSAFMPRLAKDRRLSMPHKRACDTFLFCSTTMAADIQTHLTIISKFPLVKSLLIVYSGACGSSMFYLANFVTWWQIPFCLGTE